MTILQQVLTVAAVVLGTMTTRFLPFLLFPEGKQPPAFIRYLGTVLPAQSLACWWSLSERRGLHRLHGRRSFWAFWSSLCAPVEEKYSLSIAEEPFLYGPGSDGFLIPAPTKHAARPAAVPLRTRQARAAYHFFIVYFERASRAPSPAGKDESPWPPRFPDG